MELFRAVASGGQDLDITLLGKQPRFLVGSVVEVSRRKQAGVKRREVQRQSRSLGVIPSVDTYMTSITS